jgi:hypothetical protein
LTIAGRFGAGNAFGPRLIAFDSTILDFMLIAGLCDVKGSQTLHVKQPFLDFGAEVLLGLISGIEWSMRMRAVVFEGLHQRCYKERGGEESKKCDLKEYKVD